MTNLIGDDLYGRLSPDLQENLTKGGKETEGDVYEFLKNDPQKLIRFIECTKDHLLMDKRHRDFAAKLFSQVHTLVSSGMIKDRNLEIVYDILKQHPREIVPLLPQDVALKANGNLVARNSSLALNAQNAYFRAMLEGERFLEKNQINFSQADPEVLNIINEYLKGQHAFVHKQLKKDEELLWKVIKQATEWQVTGLVETLLESVPIQPDNALDIVRYASLNHLDKLERKACIGIAGYLNEDNIQEIYDMAKTEELLELQKVCADYLLRQMPDNLSVFTRSTKSSEQIELLRAMTTPSKHAKTKEKEKTGYFSNALTSITKYLSGKPSKEEAFHFLKIAMPILADQRALPAEGLELLEPLELITLLHALPKSFKSLNLSRLNDEEVAAVLPHLPSEIRSIDLSNISLDNESLEAMVENSPLEELRLYNTLQPLENFNRPERENWLAIAGIRNLKRLDVTDCLSLTPSDIVLLISQSPDLESLKAGGSGTEFQAMYASMRSDKALKGTIYTKFSNYGDLLAHQAGRCPHLKELDLHELNISHEGVEALKQSKHQLRNLEVLDLSSCTDLTEADLIEIIKLCPNLKSLNLSQMPNSVSDKVLEVIGQRLTKLEELNISQSGDVSEGLIEMVASCPNLKALRLNNCEWMDDIILDEIGETAPKLERLELSNTNISDEGVIGILENRRFTELNLENCQLTDATLKALEKQPYLRTLNLSKNDSYSDKAAASMIAHLTDLTDLAFAECGIGNRTLKALGSCGELESLDLGACKNLGKELAPENPAYAGLANLRKLKRLDIGETSIDRGAVLKLAKSLPHLESFDFSMITMTDRDFMEIIASIPRIKALRIGLPKALFSSNYSNDAIEMLSELRSLETLEILNGATFSENALDYLLLNNSRLQFFADNQRKLEGHPSIAIAMEEQDQDRLIALRRGFEDDRKKYGEQLARLKLNK